MESAIPLLIAFVGTAFGAYFALLKTRRERLWQDRYEVLRDVVLSLEVIQSYFEATHMDDLGLTVIAEKERERLENDWPNARHELRRNIAKLRLLFKEEQIEKVTALHAQLNVAFFDLYQGTPPEHPEGSETIGKKAGETIEEVIKVAQKHCL